MAQGRGNAKAVLLALAVLALLQAVAAKSIVAGGAQKWQYPPGTDTTYYDTWSAAQSFAPGDTLVFEYPVGSHDVQIVNEAEYNACSTTSNGKVYSTGNDAIPLTKAGDYFFLCNFITHCDSGMKMKVTVKAGGAATPPVAAPTPPPVVAPTPPPVVAPAPAPVVKAPAPAPVVKAPAPAPAVKAPSPAPVKAPVPAPVKAPVPAPQVVPVIPPFVIASPAPAPATPGSSSGQSLRVCLSVVGVAAAVAFGALLL